jgi:nucleoid-associated protein YgaU
LSFSGDLNVFVDTILFALPEDKIYTAGRQGKQENVSKAAREHIKESCWETVKETVGVWERVKEAGEAIWDAVKEIGPAIKGFLSIFNPFKSCSH